MGESGKLPGGLSYAYVHYSAAIGSSFNSKGLANTVTPAGPGGWLVRLHGPGPASPAGGIQVTAVNKKPATSRDGRAGLRLPAGR